MKQLIETGEVATSAMRLDQRHGGTAELTGQSYESRRVEGGEERGAERNQDRSLEAGGTSHQREVTQRAGGKNGHGAQQ